MRAAHLYRWVVVAAALGAIVLGGGLACKKSVEGESKSWASNTAAFKELGALYPGFQPALDERLKAAQAIYDSATGLGEEQAIEKMAAANSTLMGGFVPTLRDIDKRIKDLRSKLVDAATAAGDESDRLGVKVVADAVTKTLDQVEATLKAGAKDVATAEVVVKKADADLAAAQKDVEKIISAAKAKKDEKAAVKAEDKAAAQKAEEKAAPWTCEYCGSSNEAALTKCASCGAARAEEKK